MAIHTSIITPGVVLKRITGGNPDRLGSHAEWQGRVSQLARQNPAKGLFEGLAIEVWDTAMPGYPLINYDGKGNTAAGLTWAGDKRIALGVWRGDYLPAMQTLNHEVGHYFDGKLDALPAIRDAFRRLVGRYDPEWFAEYYRAALGTDDVRGTFSDGRPANLPPDLPYLLSYALPLAAKYSGAIIRNLRVSAGQLEWQMLDGCPWYTDYLMRGPVDSPEIWRRSLWGQWQPVK